MKKIVGYNRNLMGGKITRFRKYKTLLIGGKRPHKKITRFGKYKTLSERMIAETKALNDYQKRVGQYKDI